jgi:S1-C subfamily serine protease
MTTIRSPLARRDAHEDPGIFAGGLPPPYGVGGAPVSPSAAARAAQEQRAVALGSPHKQPRSAPASAPSSVVGPADATLTDRSFGGASATSSHLRAASAQPPPRVGLELAVCAVHGRAVSPDTSLGSRSEAVEVMSVVPGSPAAEAGLRVGDAVLSWAGVAVSAASDVSTATRDAVAAAAAARRTCAVLRFRVERVDGTRADGVVRLPFHTP